MAWVACCTDSAAAEPSGESSTATCFAEHSLGSAGTADSSVAVLKFG